MPDQRGWPNPANPGFPLNPGRFGQHQVVDEHGTQRSATWLPDAGSWDKPGTLAAWVANRWTYVGPVKSVQTVSRDMQQPPKALRDG
jgi:hypothetical protein